MRKLTLRESTARRMHPLILEFLEAGPGPHSRRLQLMASLGHLEGVCVVRHSGTAKNRPMTARDGETPVDRLRVRNWSFPAWFKEKVVAEALRLAESTPRGKVRASVVRPLMEKFGLSLSTIGDWLRQARAEQARLAEKP